MLSPYYILISWQFENIVHQIQIDISSLFTEKWSQNNFQLIFLHCKKDKME